MQGRLILVHLMCRDMAAPQSIETIIGIDNDITGILFERIPLITIFGCEFCAVHTWCLSFPANKLPTNSNANMQHLRYLLS